MFGRNNTSGRAIGSRICRDYAYYRRIKRWSKKHSSRTVRRALHRAATREIQEES